MPFFFNLRPGMVIIGIAGETLPKSQGFVFEVNNVVMDRTSGRWIRETLAEHGLRLHKALGQNFLVDANIRDIIVGACDLQPSDVVVEIGPGLGALTAHLAANSRLVLALEYDRGLHALLTDDPPGANVVPVLADARQVNLDDLVAEYTGGEYGSGGKPYKVVGNLPYYLTSHLLWRFLVERFNVGLMVFMVQLEVAGRLLAAPGDKDCGALTVAIGYFCRTELVHRVPRTVFHPAPAVDSAVVRLVKRGVPPVDLPSEPLFFQLVRASFANRRKKLLNSLAGQMPDLSREGWARLLAAAGIAPERRGETLSMEEFATLTRLAWQEQDARNG